MMASTLAANSSTMPLDSGREREQEIAPMASRRRYVCEQLHLAFEPKRRGQIADLWASVTKYAERLRDGLGVSLPAHRLRPTSQQLPRHGPPRHRPLLA